MTNLTLSRRRLIAAAGVLPVAPLAVLCPRTATAAAPLLGRAEPAYYRKLGDFEVTAISDANAFIDGPWPLIGTNAKQDEVDGLMRDNLLPTNKYRPGFTPMLVNTGKALVLLDTGNGERGFVPRPDGGWLAAQLAPAGFSPEQVDVVVLSHGHFDHIGGIMDNGRPLFPNARYVIGDVEREFWTSDKPTGDLDAFAQLYREDHFPQARRRGRSRHPRR